MSPNGRYVVLLSKAEDLLPPPVNLAFDQVLFFDLQTGERELISASATDATVGGSGNALASAVSDDGRYVAFASEAGDLVTGVTVVPETSNLYFHDRSTGQTRILTLKAGSTTLAANGDARLDSFSADGRYVTFTSFATDQVAPDANGQPEAFQWDRDTGALTLISRGTSGNATGGSGSGSSRDGRYVMMSSRSTELVPGFINGAGSNDAYLWDRASGVVSLLSGALGSATQGGNGNSFGHQISDDGRYVTVSSLATDLVAGFVNTNGNGLLAFDGYLRDRQTGANTLVTHKAGSANVGANGDSAVGTLNLSADGRYVFYNTRATDIDPAVNDTNGRFDLYRYDRLTGEQRLLSRDGASATQTSADGFAGVVSWSADHSRVIFEMSVPNGTLRVPQLSLFDEASQTASLLSFTPLAGAAAIGISQPERLGLSPNGVFSSWNHQNQAWLYDDRTAAATRLSFQAGAPAVAANGTSFAAALSDDGGQVVLSTTGTNLVAGATDGNGVADVVLLDRAAQTASLVSHVAGNPLQTLAGTSVPQAISPDGRYTLFVSNADQVVAGVTGEAGLDNLYLYDRQTDLSQLISHSSASTSQAGNGATPGEAFFAQAGRHVYFQSAASNLVTGFGPSCWTATTRPSS